MTSIVCHALGLLPEDEFWPMQSNWPNHIRPHRPLQEIDYCSYIESLFELPTQDLCMGSYHKSQVKWQMFFCTIGGTCYFTRVCQRQDIRLLCAICWYNLIRSFQDLHKSKSMCILPILASSMRKRCIDVPSLNVFNVMTLSKLALWPLLIMRKRLIDMPSLNVFNVMTSSKLVVWALFSLWNIFVVKILFW